MSKYLRVRIPGACYFFTVVTLHRRQLLVDEAARTILKEAIVRVKEERAFEMPAMCLMPDHLHCIWQLPPEDNNYSVRWALIKSLFSKKYAAGGGAGLPPSVSRQKKGETGIWQRRFWEHRIRDEKDFWNHVHYIHYNPVKHGFVDRMEDWPYSTYHQFWDKGIYRDFDWGMFHTEERDIESGE